MARNYRDEQNYETDPPFGARKRDWTFIWRAMVFTLTAIAATVSSIILYAGRSYVRDESLSALESAITPMRGELRELSSLGPRVHSIEDKMIERSELLKEYNIWRSQKDQIDTKLTTMLENQQKQLERQQLLIDQLAARR